MWGRLGSIFALLLQVIQILTDPCYSCSSPHLDLRWPKDKENNKLLYLSQFPFFSNESCDQVRNLIPVVDCPGSVCVKAVIKEPPAKREACVQGGAIVRDCWSHVMNNLSPDFVLMPKSKNNQIRLAESIDSKGTVGYIFTCEGYLCNLSTCSSVSIFAIILYLFRL